MPAGQAAFESLLLDLVPVGEVLALDASGSFLGGDRSATALAMAARAVGARSRVHQLCEVSRGSSRVSPHSTKSACARRSARARGDILVQHLLEAALADRSLAGTRVHGRARSRADIARERRHRSRPRALSRARARRLLLLRDARGCGYAARRRLSGVRARARPALFALRAIRLRMGRRLLLSLLVGLQFAAASVLLTAVIVVYLQNQELRANRPPHRRRSAARHRESRGHHSRRARHAARRAPPRLPRVNGVTSMSRPPFESTGGECSRATADDEAVQKRSSPIR